MLLLIGILIILPMVGRQIGVDLDVISDILRVCTSFVLEVDSGDHG